MSDLSEVKDGLKDLAEIVRSIEGKVTQLQIDENSNSRNIADTAKLLDRTCIQLATLADRQTKHDMALFGPTGNNGLHGDNKKTQVELSRLKTFRVQVLTVVTIIQVIGVTSVLSITKDYTQEVLALQKKLEVVESPDDSK